MNFLVILICLTINYLWLKDFDRFDDGWFFRFRCFIEDASQGSLGEAKYIWLVNLALIYGLPLMTLFLAVFALSGLGFGVPTMLLHCLVLLVAFDRTQPGQLAKEFVTLLKAEDTGKTRLFLEQEFGALELRQNEDSLDLAAYFSKRLIARCFEKMFVMFFWYMLTGALGIAFCYVSYQLHDSHRENQSPQLVKTVAALIWFLEWIPMRLLALTFSLAGNFVRCFENVKESFWDFSLASDNAELLYSYSRCALAGIVTELSQDAEQAEPISGTIQEEVAEIQALQALLERSQAIWLALLAVITIFGLQL